MMDVQRAREVLLDVIELRRRFGIQVSTRDFNKDDLLDALVVLHEHNEETTSKEIVKLNRQLGAAKSREKRAKARAERQNDTIKKLEEQHSEDGRGLRSMSARIQELEAEIKGLTLTKGD